MKTYFFIENWGRDQHLEVKGYVLVVKVKFLIVQIVFLQKVWKKKINVRVFSTLRIALSCHMRSTFDETVFQQKSVFRKSEVFLTFWEGDFGCFLKDFNGFVIILAWNPDEKCCHGVN